jgi:hypothetical protein
MRFRSFASNVRSVVGVYDAACAGRDIGPATTRRAKNVATARTRAAPRRLLGAVNDMTDLPGAVILGY